LTIWKLNIFVGFSYGTSLDHFVYEKGKNVFFCMKWSRLANHLKNGPVIEWLKQDGRLFKNWTYLSGFQMVHLPRLFINERHILVMMLIFLISCKFVIPQIKTHRFKLMILFIYPQLFFIVKWHYIFKIGYGRYIILLS
jgi:hypothetical protein